MNLLSTSIMTTTCVCMYLCMYVCVAQRLSVFLSLSLAYAERILILTYVCMIYLIL